MGIWAFLLFVLILAQNAFGQTEFILRPNFEELQRLGTVYKETNTPIAVSIVYNEDFSKIEFGISTNSNLRNGLHGRLLVYAGWAESLADVNQSKRGEYSAGTLFIDQINGETVLSIQERNSVRSTLNPMGSRHIPIEVLQHISNVTRLRVEMASDQLHNLIAKGNRMKYGDYKNQETTINEFQKLDRSINPESSEKLSEEKVRHEMLKEIENSLRPKNIEPTDYAKFIEKLNKVLLENDYSSIVKNIRKLSQNFYFLTNNELRLTNILSNGAVKDLIMSHPRQKPSAEASQEIFKFISLEQEDGISRIFKEIYKQMEKFNSHEKIAVPASTASIVLMSENIKVPFETIKKIFIFEVIYKKVEAEYYDRFGHFLNPEIDLNQELKSNTSKSVLHQSSFLASLAEFSKAWNLQDFHYEALIDKVDRKQREQVRNVLKSLSIRFGISYCEKSL